MRKSLTIFVACGLSSKSRAADSNQEQWEDYYGDDKVGVKTVTVGYDIPPDEMSYSA